MTVKNYMYTTVAYSCGTEHNYYSTVSQSNVDVYEKQICVRLTVVA